MLFLLCPRGGGGPCVLAGALDYVVADINTLGFFWPLALQNSLMWSTLPPSPRSCTSPWFHTYLEEAGGLLCIFLLTPAETFFSFFFFFFSVGAASPRAHPAVPVTSRNSPSSESVGQGGLTQQPVMPQLPITLPSIRPTFLWRKLCFTSSTP